MIRPIRRFSTALVAMVALLISQLAVAAHFCAMTPWGGPAMQIHADSPCGDMPGPANLCEQHCQFGAATVDQGKPFPTLDSTLGRAVLSVRAFAFLPLAGRPGPQLPPPPEPPASIRFSVLRI